MPGREERKVVTILFTDLVGSTAMAEQLDPEDVRAVLTPYYARLLEQIEQRGGTVEKFIGDAVMAVFGAPVAHEDDPIRAVLTALAIRDSVGDELQTRTAVNTGEVLVALDANPAAGEAFVSGDVVNTAARLQSAAPVNGVLVGESTWRATRHVIDFRRVEPVAAKGKTRPVSAWEVVGAHSRLGTDVEQGHRSELVGREHELFLLEDALARCRREQTAQLVTLVGVPGIGKSRIVAELMSRLDAAPELYRWRQGRSLPYGESRSVWALGEIVKAQAAILETDDAETARGKLDAMLEELLPEPEERRWVTAEVHALAGLQGAGDESSDRRAEAFSAWRRLLEGLAEQRPLVLVFEDLQWADDTLLDFVDHLAEWVSGVPLLIVATARPELLDRRPGWGGGKRNATTLSISPLTEAETAELLAAVLDRAVLDADTQQAVLHRAEGNPLYAAEYARMLAEHEGGAELPLPETVQGVIAARIDALPPAEKALLQDASVLGKVFWPGALGSPPEALLHGLERRDFVRRDRRSAVAGETQYAFLHLLVRDVAYGQIPRAQRMERHRAAAGWIEALATDRSEDRAEMLAHHYREALRLAELSHADTEPFREPALRALAEASERAAALSSWTAAAELAADALALAPAGGARRAELLLRLARGKAYGTAAELDVETAEAARDAFLAAGEADGATDAESFVSWLYWWRGDGASARAHTERALELASGRPTSLGKAQAYARAARLESIGGEPGRALELAEDALRLADELDRDDLRSNALNSRGVARADTGDAEGAIADLRRSVEVADRSKTPAERVLSRNNLSSVLVNAGHLTEAAAAVGEARELALQAGMSVAAQWAAMAQLLHRLALAGWDAALRQIDALRAEVAPETQIAGGLAFARGMLVAARGELDAAAEELTWSLERSRAAGERQSTAPALCGLALTYHLAGQDREADELLEEIFGTPRFADPRYAFWLPLLAVERDRGADWLRAVDRESSNLWIEAGRALVAGEFAAAAERYRKLGVPFLEAWARLLAAEAGDLSQLEPARAFFAAEGARPFLTRCAALLAASA